MINIADDFIDKKYKELPDMLSHDELRSLIQDILKEDESRMRLANKKRNLQNLAQAKK